MSEACATCLRRSELLGLLAPRVAAVLASPGPRIPRLLALGEEELLAVVGGRRGPAGRHLLDALDLDDARARAARRGIGTLCRHVSGYPARLLELADPPAVLYHTCTPEALGDILGRPTVAIVGSRRASSYALEVAHGLARGLAPAGVTVISGLALGVDAAAHRGALDGGGTSVAVLACGPDVPYPRTNRGLYRRLRQRGAVVSELPPGRGVFRWSFPARNRIMAGLSELTVVVEAAERSGSLITADFAELLGREVGAVPGSVTSRRASGSNRLLRDGASVIRGPEDVLDALFGAGGAPPVAATPAPELSRTERRVLDGVEAGDSVDAIGRAAGLEAARARAVLGRLEAHGLVARDGLGGYVRRAVP